MAGEEGGGDGQHVAGVDRHLAAEAAADVRGYDPNLVLGHSQVTGYQGYDGPDRVGRLRGHPHGQLFLDRVPLGHAATGLDGGDVDTGYVYILLDRDVAPAEGPVGTLPVTDLPVPDVVALLLFILPDDGGVWLQGLERIDHNRQGIVLDLDRGDAVGGGVPVGGQHGGHLLPVELDGVHGQDHLGIAHQGGHPGQVVLLQVLSG